MHYHESHACFVILANCGQEALDVILTELVLLGLHPGDPSDAGQRVGVHVFTSWTLAGLGESGFRVQGLKPQETLAIIIAPLLSLIALKKKRMS